MTHSQVHGWPDNVYGPSTLPWNEHHAKPKEMTKDDIENLKKAWVASLKRALTAGFDVIEIHNAHVRPLNKGVHILIANEVLFRVTSCTPSYLPHQISVQMNMEEVLKTAFD